MYAIGMEVFETKIRIHAKKSFESLNPLNSCITWVSDWFTISHSQGKENVMEKAHP